MRRGTIRTIPVVVAVAALVLLASAFVPTGGMPVVVCASPAPHGDSLVLTADEVAASSGTASTESIRDEPSPVRAAQDAGGVIVSLKRTPTAAEREALGLSASSRIRGERLLVAAAPAGVTATQFADRLAASPLVEYAEPDYLLVPAQAPYSSTPNDVYFEDETSWAFNASSGTTATVAHAKSWALRGTGSANFDLVWPALANDKAGHAGAPDVRVAVIDTGFYFAGYRDMPNNIRPAIDECATYTPSTSKTASRTTTDTDVTPVSTDAADSAHGTMVASQIGQGTSNYWGSAGAAWDTRVDVYKIQGKVSTTSTYEGVVKGQTVMPDSALIRALYDAVDDAHANGYRLVINLSLVEKSGSAGSTAVREAIAYARRPEHDTVIVAAAGNDGNSVVSYPAAYDGVIAVGASTINGGSVSRASFSNYGTRLDILAPGAHIWGPTKPGEILDLENPQDAGYQWWDGTSMAAPYVSSAAALLLRVEPSLTATEVESYLTRSAVNMGAPGRDNETGWGRLDVNAAYRALATPRTTTDARLAYAENATITLSATDRDSGSNVTVYSRLDGDDPVAGRTVVVHRDPDDTMHTLQYWSEDSNGVIEAEQLFVFQVREADLFAPVSSCDSTRTYAGQAAVLLSALDQGWVGSSFHLTTHYALDGGADTTGTALVVGSTGLHTLRFWSADYAGNVEVPKVATFTVTPLPTTVTIVRSPATINHGAHIHLSGMLSLARSGDVVSIQVKTPGSHIWKNFTGYSKYYLRGITSFDLAGRGAWSTLTYTLRTPGRWYFRAVYAGDKLGLSRLPVTSSTVSVLVK